MIIWTAFLMGLLGSLHCVGMCGPIAMALPLDRESRMRTWAGALSYNIGRVFTYSVLGLVFGYLGQAFALIGIQQWVSLGTGLLILSYVYLHYVLGMDLRLRLFDKYIPELGRWKHQWARLFKRGSIPAMGGIGLLNGLLPCGFVYFALVGSMSMGNLIQGAAYMVAFGLGTAPLMILVNLFGLKVLQSRPGISRMVPYVLAVFGLLFLLRGMSLGIPYLSPAISSAEPAFIECH